MKNIWLIAQNTFRETARDRVLMLITGFAILITATTLLAASVSLGQELRVIESFGLTALLIFLLIMVIFVATQLLWREIERKTIYFLLSKPVSREQFFLGKYLGIVLTTTLAGVILGITLIIVLLAKGHPYTLGVVLAIFFILLEAYLLTSVSLLFGTFTSPLASAIYTFCLFLIGHSSNTIWTISQKASGAIRYSLETVYYVFPNLEKFNLRNEVIYALKPETAQLLSVILYFVGFTTAMLLLSIAILRRREF